MTLTEPLLFSQRMRRRLQPPSLGDSRDQQAAACEGLPCSGSSTLAGAEGPGNWALLGHEEQTQAANSCSEPTEPISRAPLPSPHAGAAGTRGEPRELQVRGCFPRARES